MYISMDVPVIVCLEEVFNFVLFFIVSCFVFPFLFFFNYVVVFLTMFALFVFCVLL